MIDLDEELRDLYADIAAESDDGAAERIRATLANPHRGRGLGRTVAAAVTVAACVGLGAVAIARHEHEATRAGAVAPTTCVATLPSGWQRALTTAKPILVDGVPAFPIGLTGTGDAIVGWKTRNGPYRIGVTDVSGTTRPLLSLGRHLGGGSALEGDTLVVSPTRWGSSMAVINVRTGRAHNVSLEPAMPPGYLASDGVAIQAGVAYFGASPRRDGIGGVIIGYDLTSDTSQIVARTTGPVFVRQDARGVVWAAGEIRRAATPGDVPGPGAVHEVVGDGTAYAWNADRPRRHQVRWTSRDGSTKTFTVHTPDHPSAVPVVMAVSGPYVLLFPYSGQRPFPDQRTNPAHLSVLDTRTGAVAGLGIRFVDVSAAGLPTALAFTDEKDATLRIATAGLPELQC